MSESDLSRPWDQYANEGGLSIEDLLRPAGGRNVVEITIYSSREITQADIYEAAQEGGLVDAMWGNKQTVVKLRNRHHRIAELLAQNLTHSEVCEITGYSMSRIEFLLQDSSFRALIEHYRSRARENQQDLVEQLRLLATDAASELHDRLEENPGAIKSELLLEVLKASADRVGVGPTMNTRNLNLTGRLTPDQLEAAKRQITEKEQRRLVKPTLAVTGPTKPAESERSLSDEEGGGGAEVRHLRHPRPEHSPTLAESEEPEEDLS